MLKANKLYKIFGSRDGSAVHQQVLEEFKFNMWYLKKGLLKFWIDSAQNEQIGMWNMSFRWKTWTIWIKRGFQGISLLIKNKDGEGDKLFVPFCTRKRINTVNLLDVRTLSVDKYCLIAIIWDIYNSLILRVRNHIGRCQGLKGGEGSWGQSFHLGRWKIWEMDDGESYTMMWMYLVNCIVKYG